MTVAEPNAQQAEEMLDEDDYDIPGEKTIMAFLAQAMGTPVAKEEDRSINQISV